MFTPMSMITSATRIEKAITEVRKRDGRIVPFDALCIENAEIRAMQASEEGSETGEKHVAEKVYEEMLRIKELSRDPRFLPSIELIQDVVEKMLMQEGFGKTAKAYILYREKRRELRDSR